MSVVREAKLICVAINTKGASNSNKFYNLKENTDGSLVAEYGRVGVTKQIVNYPAGKKNFEKIIKSKEKKGYKDITGLKATTDPSNPTNDIFAGITEVKVVSLMKFLMDASKNMVSTNYLIATDDVTKAQLDKAQDLINDTIQHISSKGNKNVLNKLLIELYTILPRKMKNVKDHLVDSLQSDSDIESLKDLIATEQNLLSTLESQILTNTQTTSTAVDNKNILEEMGLEVSIETDTAMLDKINFFLGQNKQYAKNIYKVVNTATQKRFDDHVSQASNKKVQLLWHGSRNTNILSIFQQGLKIRPVNAIHTGSMFSDGAYFSTNSQKSLGYSSLSGSYWTGGNESKGFLFLFSVHTGKALDIYRHDSSCYSLDKRVKREGYDSVFAHKGPSLRNDEIITYNESQSTISYLIEMEK